MIIIAESSERANLLLSKLGELQERVIKTTCHLEEAYESNPKLIIYDCLDKQQIKISDIFKLSSLNATVVLVGEFDKSTKLNNLKFTSLDKLSQTVKEEIEAKEDLLKIILSSAEIGVWDWDLLSDKVFLSPECKKILGVETSTDYEGNYLKFVALDEKEEIRNRKLEAIFSGKPFQLELPFNSPFKGLIWISVFGKAQCDHTGKPIRVIGTVQDITKRKEIEQNLLLNEARFRLITDVTPVMIAQLDANMNCQFVNQSFCKFYNLEADKAIGRNIRELIKDERFESLFKGIEKALKGEISKREIILDFEYKKTFLSVDYIPDRDEKGQVRGCFLFIKDNTDSRLAFENLKESEERFRSLVKATNQIVWVSPIKGAEEPKIRFLFDSISKIGYIERRFHPEDYENLISDLKENAQKGNTYSATYRVFHPEDNSYHIYALSAFPILKDGKVREFIGTMTDITEKQKTEQEIRFQAELLNMVDQAILTTDHQGKLLYWNKFAEGLFGWKDENVQGEDIFELVVPEESRKAAKEITIEVLKGTPWSGEFEMKKRDGSRFIASCSLSPVSENGRTKLVIGLIQDITEKKEAERKLQESMEQLRQAQKLESIGRLAGGIAHDFNNMLTAIKGYSELALRQISQESGLLRRSIEEIKKAAERSSLLTQQLLAFSRRQIMKTETLDLNQNIKENIFLIQRLVGEDIVISLSLNAKRSYIEADAGQLAQVLTNLAVNSRDAMPNGGIITIKTEDVYLDESFVSSNLEAKKGMYVKLSFEDNGCGMDEETIKHIFEPFFTTKPIGKGTGLGLSTVYGIVKQLNGFITCKSKLGKGTCFEIFLPITQKIVKETEQEKEIQQVKAGKILLVEDEEMVRALTKELLESCGYEVFEARNAKEAISFFFMTKEKPDLLISDVVMPGVSGYELATKIREKAPTLPVLFISGYVDQVEKFRKFENERTFFIQKPFSNDSLIRAVSEIIEKNRPKNEIVR